MQPLCAILNRDPVQYGLAARKPIFLRWRSVPPLALSCACVPGNWMRFVAARRLGWPWWRGFTRVLLLSPVAGKSALAEGPALRPSLLLPQDRTRPARSQGRASCSGEALLFGGTPSRAFLTAPFRVRSGLRLGTAWQPAHNLITVASLAGYVGPESGCCANEASGAIARSIASNPGLTEIMSALLDRFEPHALGVAGPRQRP